MELLYDCSESLFGVFGHKISKRVKKPNENALSDNKAFSCIFIWNFIAEFVHLNHSV